MANLPITLPSAELGGSPGVTTLAAMRTTVRQRAGMENSQFVTDSELNGYINASAYELYDLLVQKFGDDYYAEVYSFSTDGTNTRFSLPTDFYKMLAVDLVLTTAPNGLINIPRFSMTDRNVYGTTAVAAILPSRTNMRYRLSGNALWMMPLPPTGLTIQLTYIPRLSAMTSDSDTWDAISGWEEYIITDAVIKCLQKEESLDQVASFVGQKAALIQRIEAAAENRDASIPETVTDALGQNGGVYPFGPGGPGWGGGYGW